MSSSW